MTDLSETTKEKRFRGLDQAIELAASGEVEKAVDVILSNIPELYSFHELTVTMALEAEVALEAIRSGSDDEAHSAALYDLAQILAFENDFEQALKIAKLIRDESYRALTLSQISVFLAEEGRFEDALNTLAEITDALERSSAVIAVAEQLALTGESEKAVDLARQITDEGYRSMVLEEIGIALIEVGKFEYGLECLRNSGAVGSETWFQACAETARLLARRGEFLNALKLVREIEDDSIRSKALHWIEAELVIKRMLARIEEGANAEQGAEEVC
jgi:predicted negative regulator of RcsB-dependent stress response